MICREFFRKYEDAKRWAYEMGACVVDVYSLDKPGTVRKFEAERAEMEFYGRTLSAARAVVLYVR